MERQIRTSANYASLMAQGKIPTRAEKNSGISDTKPDMTYTPAELLTRYAKGLPMEKLRGYAYHGDNYVPDPRRMDLTELDEALDAAKADVIEKQKAADDKYKARLKKSADERKKWEDFYTSMNKNNNTTPVVGV